MVKKPSNNQNAIKISVIYFFISAIWILASDKLLLYYTKDYQFITQLQTYKGWFFITGSSFLIFFLINNFEKGLKSSINQLKKANNDLKLFFYKTSHDLRGPIASSLGIINVAKDEINEDKALDYLNKLNKETSKTDNILHDLIELTRIMDGEIKSEFVDVSFLLNNVLKKLSHLKGYQNTSFILNLEHVDKFKTDPNILKIILENIIENAIIYQNYGSNKPTVSIIIKYHYNKIKIDVIDNGIGIDPENKDKVFEMFFRGSRLSNGGGLGLYLAKTGINILGGEIEVKSTVGKGSSFSIYIPEISDIKKNSIKMARSFQRYSQKQSASSKV